MTTAIPIKWMSIVAFALAFTAFSIKSKHLAEQGDRALTAETGAMLRLAVVARAMIADGGEGVRGTDDHRYIASFAAFYEYIAEKHPEAVSSPNAANPFPGFLPGKSYNRLSGVAKGGEDILISSDIYHRPPGDITGDVRCDGLGDVQIKKR
jgi:hypothetical protein